PHRIMGEYENGGQLHQSRQPNGGARIITKDEERGAERTKLRQCETVDRGRHCMPANAEMQVSASSIVRLEVAGPRKGEQRLIGGTEVRRSSQQPGNILGE